MADDTYSPRNIRASLQKFLLGKAITAPGTFLLVFVLATVMPGHEYAAYIAASSGLELALAMSSLGLDWLMQTAIPSARAHGNPFQLRRLIASLAALQTLPYVVAATVFWLAAAPMSAALGGVASPELLRIYGLILLVEGLGGRMLRDQVLSALLMQGVVQLLSILRLLSLAIGVAYLYFAHGSITSVEIAWLEFGASALTLIAASAATLVYLSRTPAGGSTERSIARWLNRDSFRFARNAYGSFMLTICLGPELATVFVARFLGVEATAMFGFTIRVVEQVRRFLPMDLLWSLIRPALAGRYETLGRSYTVLSRDVTLILRSNIILLGGAMVVFVAVGEQLIALATLGKMILPPLLLASFLPQILGHSVRRSLELITFVIGHSHLFLRGSFAAPVAPAILLVLMPLMPSLYLVALGMIVAEVMFSGIVAFGLIRLGRPLSINVGQWGAFAVVVILCGGLGAFISRQWPTTPGMLGAASVAGLTYLACLPLLGVASMKDLGLLAGLARTRSNGAT